MARRRCASSPTWAICPRRCATTWRGSAGATATTRSSPTPRRRPGSTSLDVVSAPARLDWPKLNHINQHYIREADDGRLQGLVTEILRSRDVHLPSDFEARLARTIPLVKEGAKTTLELADLTLFALKPRPIQLDDKAKALLTEEVRSRLRRLAETLRTAPDWSSARAARGPEGVRRRRGRVRQVRAGAAAHPGRRRGRARPRQRPLRARPGRESRDASRMLFRKCSKPL